MFSSRRDVYKRSVLDVFKKKKKSVLAYLVRFSYIILLLFGFGSICSAKYKPIGSTTISVQPFKISG